MRDTLRDVLIVGASIAGVRAAQALRRRGYAGALHLAGDEDVLAYRRPELSKRFLAGQRNLAQIAAVTPEELDGDVLLGTKATALDVGERQVWLREPGRQPRPYRFDGVVIATGASARRLPGPPMAGVHVLRDHLDAGRLRTELLAGPRVVVVGGGLIGCEVAATCRALGLPVVVVEPAPWLLAGALGETVGARITELHRDRGVDVRLEVGVAGLRGGSRVESVVTTDGRVIAADVVVVGIGSEPNTEWLAGSGLPVHKGLICAPNLAVAAHVVAAGDVVAWQAPGAARPIRLEHWDSAVRQADTAARTLLEGDSAPAFDGAGLFWSEQFDRTVHVLGDPRDADEVLVFEHDPARERLVACYARHGHAVGFALLNAADWLGHAGQVVRRRPQVPVSEAVRS